MSGAINGNSQFKFFGIHCLRWDANSLNILETNHTKYFFPKDGVSDNNQPKNNGPNACLKYWFNNEKEQWFDQWGIEHHTLPHMN